MDIDLKSAGIGAGVIAAVVGVGYGISKLFGKEAEEDKTTTLWDELSGKVELMKEIVDSNMPASLIKEAGEEVGITFTGECRKEMVKILFLHGKDGVAAIKSQYEKWKNKEFSSQKKEENSKTSESQTEETKE